ncbi:MAG: LamG-like jellyroll fold domain-containing protein [Bacteroidia bacterium]
MKSKIHAVHTSIKHNMRKKLFLILLIAFVQIAFPQLFTRYDFNNDYADLTGNGFNGTGYGTTFVSDRHGNPNSAVHFNGTGEYIDCGGIGLNATYLTISMWAKRPTYDGAAHCLLGQGIVQSTDNTLNIAFSGQVIPGQEAIGFDMYADAIYDTTGAKDPNWNHWTFTYDYTNGNTIIYRNGHFVNSSVLGAYVGNGSVYLGCSGWQALWFAGDIDDVRIWDQVLTAAQVDSVFLAEKPVCPPSLGLSTNIGDVTCFGYNNGGITVNVANGFAPYTYTYNGVPGAYSVAGFTAGNYTVVVTDAGGCADSIVAVVNQPTPLSVVMSATNTTCYNGTDGITDASVSGGVAPYYFTWSPVNASTQTVYSLNAGMYHVQITDTYGCYLYDSVIVGQPGPFNGNITVSSPTVCLGEPDTLSVSVSGGQSPYWYEWHNFSAGVTDTTYVDSLILAPVGTGSTVIGVYIYDALGCSSYASAYFWTNPGDSLSGKVIEPNLNPVTNGMVYLIHQKQNHVGLGDTTAFFNLGAGGTFFGKNIPWGDYFLKVVADTNFYPNSIGTYYSNKTYPYQWDSALIINHRTCSGLNDSGKNVTIIEIVPQVGSGDISGTIYSVPGFGNRQSFPGYTPQGAPLKGVDIKLGKNPGGSPAARTTTDGGGYYHFYNVPLGSYKIYVDIPNYGMDSARTVDLTPADTSSNKNDYYVDSNIVHVVPHYDILVTTAICNGDSVLAAGSYQHATGIYVDSLLAAMGGDSVITTNLTVNSLPMVIANTTADTICSGGNVTLSGGGASTYTWSGSVIDGAAFSPSVTDTYTVTGTDGNGCNDTATVRVVVQTCVGINSYGTVARVTAYPNPATDKIIVTCTNIPLGIQIQSMAGETILDAGVSGNRSYVDVSKLAAGVYFVKVQVNMNESKLIRILKN